jgi:hypothetical protein
MIQRLKESHRVVLLCNVFEVHCSGHKYRVTFPKEQSPEKAEALAMVEAHSYRK